LIEHLEDICKSNKLKHINALVKTNNKKMQNLNKKLGFKKGDTFYFYEKYI
jgi:RimJ/RimL family protein N-acetyltransferase